MATYDLTDRIDAPFSTNISRRRFMEVSAGAVAGVSLGSLMSGCVDKSQPQELEYPIASEVHTTRYRAIAPIPVAPGGKVISPWEPSTFRAAGYGLWRYVDGVDAGKRVDIIPAGYAASSVSNTALLLRFFAITDTHVYDKESPSQPFYGLMQEPNGTPSIPAITFTMLYTTHILDAAIQTVNALHKDKSFDCGLFLGDACNNSQYNEVRWYLDVIDGKVIEPSSGAHAGADTIDYQKPYKAAGLDKTLPWYQTKGSHDNFWFGSNPVTEYLRQNYIGEDLLRLGAGFAEPPIGGPSYCMGTVDGSTAYGNIIGTGPASDTSAVKVAADPNRRSLDMNEWMREFFNTSSSPAGHGFTQTNIDRNFASYSFEPKSNVPIKIIMLDDTQSQDGPQLANYGNGSLDYARYDWLLSELDKGQAEGKLMIVAAHVPICVEPFASDRTGSWGVEGAVLRFDSWVTDYRLKDIIQEKYSNLILWLAGHQHNNQVTAWKSPDAGHPEFGFWEVQTASLRDFPQHFRTFDIVRNTDNTVSIIITDVDPAAREGSPAAMSRFYAVAASQLYTSPTVSAAEPTGAYNAELIKQLSPEMQAKIQNYGTRISS